jgi:hypothetical protein
MSLLGWLVALGALIVASCSSAPDVEWMKVGQPYTTAEFRRDYSQCERTPSLDDCLRSRGWVSVTAQSAPKQVTPEIRQPGGGLAPGKRY